MKFEFPEVYNTYFLLQVLKVNQPALCLPKNKFHTPLVITLK